MCGVIFIKNKITSIILALALMAGALSVRYLDKSESTEAMTGRGYFMDNISLGDLADTLGQRLQNGGDSN